MVESFPKKKRLTIKNLKKTYLEDFENKITMLKTGEDTLINEINEIKKKEEFDKATKAVVERDTLVIGQEEQAVIDEKFNEIKAKVDKYKAAQEYQRKHGGAGPVADFETMKIVNEYNGQFEIVFEED